MGWKEEDLDFILVPMGVVIMAVYHVILSCKYCKCPERTEIGFENHNKREWVKGVMKLPVENRGTALTVIGSHISAATTLSSISLALSSLIGAWIGGSSNHIISTKFVYGGKSTTIYSIKYGTILLFFLLAFACFVQTTRYFVHCSFLMSNPNGVITRNTTNDDTRNTTNNDTRNTTNDDTRNTTNDDTRNTTNNDTRNTTNDDALAKCVERAVIRGSNFWSAGLRALYFAITLLLWIFGPIPMFVSSLVMLVILIVLDRNTRKLIRYKGQEDLNKKRERQCYCCC